ncbi:MAG TPA: hypothetical protein PK413_11000, partial [Thermoanaerobaculia bacterium]|nr:hypothetical protein [Thermoanaerobaculia bacterium]
MDHTTIEERGFVDLYRRGQLSLEDEAAFEEHFVGCAECQQELAHARGLALGVQALGAEAARRALFATGLLAWLARRSLLGRLALGLGALLLAALPSLWLLRRQSEAAAASAAWQHRFESQQAEAGSLAQKLETERARGDQERERLEARIAQLESQKAAPPPATLEGPTEVPVYLLTTLRGEAEPAPTVIHLAQAGPLLSLALDAGPRPPTSTFALTLSSAQGQSLFRREGLRPNALEVLQLTLPKTFLSPGDYLLSAEEQQEDGHRQQV